MSAIPEQPPQPVDRRSFLTGTVIAAGTAVAGAAAISEAAERPTAFRQGTKELVFAVDADTKFETLVSILKEVLVVPELPGIRGCRPCLSGLDRLVLTSRVLERIRDIG